MGMCEMRPYIVKVISGQVVRDGRQCNFKMWEERNVRLQVDSNILDLYATVEPVLWDVIDGDLNTIDGDLNNYTITDSTSNTMISDFADASGDNSNGMCNLDTESNGDYFFHW